MKTICITYIALLLCGCIYRYQPSLVVMDYVPASDVIVPDMQQTLTAANAGDPVAQTRMGELSYHGLGMPKNHKTASVWWKQAANLGYAPAQYLLGMLYFKGSGIKTDFVEGCKWLGLAAAKGHAQAAAAYHARCTH